ncbi:MAG TPA: BMP family ABC transporter substrate-binding protein [Microbacteriaceae bacterium]|nr:BMP family ABC transporter substrate-binding protein [Microbacteriaceae bacterium]
MSHRMKLAVSALVAGAALVLAGCSAPPPSASPSSSSSSGSKTASSKFMPCVVSDTAGFNDHSFNQLSLQAVQEAAKKAGTTYKMAKSQTASDYVPNVNQLVAAGCTATVASGFNLVAAIKGAAKANTNKDFVMVDDNSINLPNVKDVVFATNQAAFLGGYAAAAYSKTGVVATWGGQEIPPVTIYMDGFWDGVQYYNQQNHKNVKVLGWNEKTQKGTFVGNFTDQNTAKTDTTNFINQKADVIMPVAGPLYEGAGAAIRATKANAVLVGVDADLFKTDTSGYKDLILLSVMKGIQPAVATVLDQSAAGQFSATQYIGTLKNNGVAISPFHDFTSKVPKNLSAQLAKIKAGIIDGSIQAPSPAEPKG